MALSFLLVPLLLAAAHRGAKPAASPPPRQIIGVVSEIAGSVEIRKGRGAASKPARIGYALRAGDALELGPDGSATIVLPAKCEVVRAPAATARTLMASGSDVTASAGELTRRPLDPCLAAVRITADPDSTLRAGATVLRGATGLLLLEPADLKVCTPRPRIRWKSEVDAASARITILDTKGVRIATGSAAHGSQEVDFPGSAPLIIGESYRVTVDLLDAAGRTLGTADAPFSIATQPEIDAVTRSHGLLAAMYADDAGCFVDALRLYREAAGDDPPENVARRVKWLTGVLGGE